MMTYNTDMAVMVICLIKMVMGHCRERGEEEQKNEKNGKIISPVYSARSAHERTLRHELEIVKKLFGAGFVRSSS